LEVLKRTAEDIRTRRYDLEKNWVVIELVARPKGTRRIEDAGKYISQTLVVFVLRSEKESSGTDLTKLKS
jgi:hypothetical protein